MIAELDPATWGTGADWLAAIGTVGALALTYVLLRKELGELNDARTSRVAEDERRRRANAMKLQPRIVRQGGIEGPDGYTEADVEVRNDGDEPFLNVTVGLHKAPRERAVARSNWWFVAPHAAATTVRLQMSNSEAEPRAEGVWLVEMRFTDDEGVTWHRDHMGALRRVEAAPAPHRDAVDDEYG
jgi:hypothetical protein